MREPVVVHHPKFRFRMWLPKRTSNEHIQFMTHIREIDKRANAESATYWPLLNPGPATVDEDSRISRDGTLYTKLLGMPQVKGATGLVFLVREVGPEGTMLCAKQMRWTSSGNPGIIKHVREKTEKEFQSYRRYSHVGIPNSPKHRVANANGQHYSRTLLLPSTLPACILALPRPG